MVGGSNYRESQFNLAVQGERQPGSAFKPFVLAAALERGRLAGDALRVASGRDPARRQALAGQQLRGLVPRVDRPRDGDHPLRQLGLRAADVDRRARRTSRGMARDAGIRSKLNSYFAIGLGAEAANPLEMARAFSTFANGGQRIDGSILGNQPRAVSEDRQARRTSRSAIASSSPEKTAILNSILQKVVTQGTGRRAALSDRPVAGKTGTTENYGDAWFVGYVPQLTVAVWVGYPRELRPMETEFHGEPVAGGTFPAEIWHTFMQEALRVPEEGAAVVPVHVRPVRVAARGRLPRREAAGRQRQLPLAEGGALLLGAGAAKDCELQAERGRRARSRRPAGAGCARTPAGQPLTRVGRLQGREAAASGSTSCSSSARRKGRLSAYDRVTLVVAKPTHGVVPRLVGMPLERAQREVRAARPQDRGRGGIAGAPGRVVFQLPRAGVAAAPGMTVRIAVAA